MGHDNMNPVLLEHYKRGSNVLIIEIPSTMDTDKDLSGSKKLPFHLQSSHTRLLIKNGTVVNADASQNADVYIEDGIIKQIGRNLVVPGGSRVIDACKLLVMPGGIDPHTHFEFEFMGQKAADDFYAGTKAAVIGGTTTIIDFAIPQKGESLISKYLQYRKMADEKVCCDYALHVGVTSWNDEVKREMRELCKTHGVNSFKIFLAYKDLYMVNDEEMYGILEECASLGALAMVHAENGTIIKENTKRLLASGVTGPEGHELSRPEDVEAEAVFRACTFANQVKCPLYINCVTSSCSANIVKSKQLEGGQVIFGECLVSAIGGDSVTFDKIAMLVASPPLRTNPNISYHLLGLLESGDLQVVSSDHCSFTKKQKEIGIGDFSKIPNGVHGVEERMMVVWEKGVASGILTPSQFVAITSANAAKIFNIYPKKGRIEVGSDADIVLWNPEKRKTISAKHHHHNSDYNIFEGMVCRGLPDYVILNGRVCVEEGEIKPMLSRGSGKFIPAECFAPFVYKKAEKNGKLVPDHIDGLNDFPKLGMQNARVDSPDVLSDDDRSSICSIAGSPVSYRAGKGMRKEGQRDLHSSSFSIASDKSDGSSKPSIRVREPPGGRSSGFW